MVQCRMRNHSATAAWRVLLLILTFFLPAPGNAAAQRERQVEPPSRNDSEQRFFEQLRNLFGRFRDADLQRAFEMAQPISCSALISGNGEWRTVAFFNEDRKLGDFYHSSLVEVNADPSVYLFNGECSTDRSRVQVVTKFPVRDSLDRYAAGRIRYDDIDVNVNAAVTVSFELRTQAYRFELPYLYAVRARGSTETVYSLTAQRITDRYATNVTNRWDCKSVGANDLTFQFLICETWTLPRNVASGSRADPSFGAVGYFILSDGKEASTSVKLSFGGPGSEVAPPVSPEPTRTPDAVPDAVRAPAGREGWQIPASASKLAEVNKNEFRVRFSPQTWTNKIDSSQVLLDQKILSSDSAKPQSGIDYCAWRPASSSNLVRLLSNEPDEEVGYTLTTADAPVSTSFEMKTHNGFRLGTLQCFFPKAESAASIPFDRWVAVVGAHLTLEIRP